MKHIYLKTLDWKAIVLEPRVMGVIREEGGKMYMGEEKWYEACEEFYEGFRGYQVRRHAHYNSLPCDSWFVCLISSVAPPQEANDSRAKDALKYMVLANMLALSDINPFAAHETKAFQEETEIMAMQMLRSAYEANDLASFERTLEKKANHILADPFIMEYVEPLRRRMLEKVILASSVLTSANKLL